MSKTRDYRLWSIAALVGFCVVVGLLLANLLVRHSPGAGWGDPHALATIEIEGPIFDSEETLEKLEELRKYKDVKGVILRINSPGGGVGPTQEIYESIESYRKATGTPIYASIGSMAASGGYWIALAADKIYASPGSVTGSIGVIMGLVNLEELYQVLRIRPLTLKAGKFKDMGSPQRPMTEEEEALFQNLLDELHQQFKEKVLERRKISEGTLNDLAQGQVFTGQQALKMGLVDALGGVTQVVMDMKADLRLPEEIKPFTPQPKRSFRDWMEHWSRSMVLSVLERLIPAQTF
jgi:protease-4